MIVYLQGESATGHSWLPLLCITVYTAASTLGLGSLPYIYIGELYSAELRPVLGGVTMGLAQLELFINSITFPSLHTAMTDGAVFWMYGGICLLGAFFALLFVPETKDKVSFIFKHINEYYYSYYVEFTRFSPNFRAWKRSSSSLGTRKICT